MSVTSTVVHRAETRFVEAAAPLRPYVGCFWVITAERGARIQIVPDGSTSISIELRNGRSSEWFLRGPLVRPDMRRFSSAATLVGVRLRPGVSFLVSGVSAHAMVGRRIRLGGHAFHALADEDCFFRTPEQHIDALQQFLLERLANAHVHTVVARALRYIERTQGCVRIGDLAADCSISPRHLNRLMRRWVGYGAKRLCRIVRFQATLAQIAQAPARSGAALASETGYFDQAHLTLDTGRLSGATPRRLASRHAAGFYKTRCDAPL
jgi:AraC-like DNA-binding protein